MLRSRVVPWVLLFAAACGTSDSSAPTSSTGDEAASLVFDVSADVTQADHFFDRPYPSDLRLTADGTPDLSGFPNPQNVPVVEAARTIAREHPGFPVVPVTFFRFTKPVASGDPEKVIAADPASPVLLVDVDPSSPDRGSLYPVVAASLEPDLYTPDGAFAVAPRPGIVLHGHRRYGVVVRRQLGDATGAPLGVTKPMADLAAGIAPGGTDGEATRSLYAPLFETLKTLGVPASDVAAATVFTTGDVVEELAALSSKLVQNYPVQIQHLALDPTPNDRVCMLKGTIDYPQFQAGKPPFDTEGLFQKGDGGLPKKQRIETAPVAITLPKTEMQKGGFPLVVYFHGSGGSSDDILNAGPSHSKEGPNDPGTGPAYHHAPHGFADAGSALPVNPDRLPGAATTAYLNVNNIAAMRDTFRQGVVEQHMFIEALRTLTIDPALISACSGAPTLPAGETSFHFDADKLVAQGQSMGGMYTNLIGATEPRIRAVVPTGAGGFWSYFILKTSLIPNLPGILGVLFRTHAKLTFLHPVLALLETGLEPSDPMVYTPRLARRHLQNHPVRPVYEPVGKGDEYFPIAIYDAMALAYGHKQAGDAVWPSMQEALGLEGLSGILGYPVKNDLKAEDGTAYTGAVVQYEGDGVDDPHYIYRQRDEVKYQYGCFLESFVKTGQATIAAPAPLGTPCP